MYARQAIQTKFIAPTKTRGARVKAFCEAKAIIVPWDDSQNVDENHYEAALLLARAMGWETKGVTFGCLPNGGYALTFPVTPLLSAYDDACKQRSFSAQMNCIYNPQDATLNL